MILDELDPFFATVVEKLKARLAAQGVVIRPYCGVRDPFEQARLWRQSRTAKQIQDAVEMLREAAAPRLAECIVAVGPQRGKPVTNAMPGFSWHQYGQAVDCFVAEGGRAVWDAEHPGYALYASVAEELGLKAGRSFGDTPHVQAQHREPQHLYDFSRIDNLMAARFPAFAALAKGDR